MLSKASSNLTDRPTDSEGSQEVTAEEVGGWQLEGSAAWELAAEGSVWSPPCEDVSPETGERPPLEAVTKQRDGGH
jgi:hypothetical protein